MAKLLSGGHCKNDLAAFIAVIQKGAGEEGVMQRQDVVEGRSRLEGGKLFLLLLLLLLLLIAVVAVIAVVVNIIL